MVTKGNKLKNDFNNNCLNFSKILIKLIISVCLSQVHAPIIINDNFFNERNATCITDPSVRC